MKHRSHDLRAFCCLDSFGLDGRRGMAWMAQGRVFSAKPRRLVQRGGWSAVQCSRMDWEEWSGKEWRGRAGEWWRRGDGVRRWWWGPLLWTHGGANGGGKHHNISVSCSHRIEQVAVHSDSPPRQSTATVHRDSPPRRSTVTVRLFSFSFSLGIISCVLSVTSITKL